jgi:hypothetical protein
MAAVRGWLATCVTLVAVALAGCGGSSTSTPAPTVESPGAALEAWYRAVEHGDAKRACGLLTGHGRRAIEGQVKKSCATVYSSPRRGPMPRIGPVGIRGDLALAVTGTKPAGVSNVTALRRFRGRWLIDLASTPVLDSLDVAGIPPIERESLPSGGQQLPDVLGAAARYVDKQASSGGPAVHVATAAVVGDVAIAYLLPGSDVPGARPSSATYGSLILTRGAHGWRPLGGTTVSTP